MKRFSLVMCAAWMAATLSAGTVNYTADNSTIFANPERGFITMLTEHLTRETPYAVVGEETKLEKKKKDEKMSIVLVHYYLDNFKTNATLPSEVLDGFDADMQVLREIGMKAIVRFSYAKGTYGEGKEESAADASLDIVKQHLAQYKPHWDANADVIFVFQAGIVGAWGEWYYSDHFGNQMSHMNEARCALIDTLLKAVPADRGIQIRTPLFKTEYLEYLGQSKSALTTSEAYQNTAKARLGHHNDAFLYHADNMGTYKDTAVQKPYIAQETLYVPIGGETDIEDPDQAAVEASYDATIAEMSRLHWTFIQSGFSEVVTDMWRENGTFDELNRRMGYRLQLVKGTYGEQVEQGGKLALNLQIRNTGFAPLYNERHAYLVLKNGTQTYPLPVASDPRSWLPNGVVTTINEQITVPASVPAGTYQLYLHLPDAYTSLAADPRYAVRFANNGIWDEETGMNALHASVEVTAKSIDPEPDPEPEPYVPGEPVLLPATLSKANVQSCSDDMTWYNTDYFDFGPTDEENTGRWAQWDVELRYPGKYIVSEIGYCANGHSYLLTLKNGNDTISTFTAEDTDHWGEGDQSYTQSAKWDLTAVSKGTYTLVIRNSTAWGQPKLKSITLSYDGDLPTGIESAQPSDGQTAQKLIIDQTIYIRKSDKLFSPTGQEVKTDK